MLSKEEEVSLKVVWAKIQEIEGGSNGLYFDLLHFEKV